MSALGNHPSADGLARVGGDIADRVRAKAIGRGKMTEGMKGSEAGSSCPIGSGECNDGGADDGGVR
jgi:hypothetical protein